MSRLNYLFFFLIFSSMILSARAQNISVSATLQRDSIWLGDQIKMILVAEYPAGTKIEFPQLKDSLPGGIELLSKLPADSSTIADGRIQMRQPYVITCFDSGPRPIAPLKFVHKSGGIRDTIRSNSQYLFVKVPYIDLKKGFTDIKKPYGAPITFKEVAPWILGIILVATIVFLLIYAISRRRRNIPLFQIPAKPKLPPHIIALSELDKLKEEQLWQHDKVKDYYTRLTDILRVYLEERFEVPAMEQTTHEILSQLKGDESPIKGKLFDGLQKTLNTADLVKFAKYTPLADENHFVLVNAYTMVEETKIQEEPPKKAEMEQKKAIVDPITSTENEIKNQP